MALLETQPLVEAMRISALEVRGEMDRAHIGGRALCDRVPDHLFADATASIRRDAAPRPVMLTISVVWNVPTTSPSSSAT